MLRKFFDELPDLSGALPEWLMGPFAGDGLIFPPPRTYQRTEPTPYRGRAKFRYRVKPGDGPECFEERAVSASELVVQLPPQAWKVSAETAGHVIASQIGQASRRQSGVIKPKWG